MEISLYIVGNMDVWWIYSVTFAERSPASRQGDEKLTYRLIHMFSSTEIFSKRRKIYAYWRKTRAEYFCSHRDFVQYEATSQVGWNVTNLNIRGDACASRTLSSTQGKLTSTLNSILCREVEWKGAIIIHFTDKQNLKHFVRKWSCLLKHNTAEYWYSSLVFPC